MIVVEIPTRTIEAQLDALSDEYITNPESLDFVTGARAALNWILRGWIPPVEVAQAMRQPTDGGVH